MRPRGGKRIRAVARGSLCFVGLASVSVAATTGMAVGMASASAVAIALSKTSGPPTSTITVTGTGFTPSKRISVTFAGSTATTTTSDTSGNFKAAVTVPKSTVPGSYSVSASDNVHASSATFMVRTNWVTFGFSAAASGNNPYENVLNTATVKSLSLFGTGTGLSANSVGASPSPPVVYDGEVFVTDYYHHLFAFKQTCLVTAKVCSPLWSASAGIAQDQISVANGVVYVPDASFTGIDAYSTSGSLLWKGTTPFSGGGGGGPVVANKVVYFPDGRSLYAFSTNSLSANCSTSSGLRTCTPLWSSKAASASISQGVTISGGLAYVSADKLYAFNATANASTCTTSAGATTCSPVWTGTSYSAQADGQPVVAAGEVYVDQGNGILYQYPTTAGGANCSGPTTARTCTPHWKTGISFSYGAPAIANGMIFANANSFLAALSASTGALVWTTPQFATGQWGTPVAANGVVYTGDGNNSLGAYSEGKTAQCATAIGPFGNVPTCHPLWTATQKGAAVATPVVADGAVYVSGALSSGGGISVYHA